jgi:hypothetical protein
MMRGYFYPAGREKIHSVGALDMALWDLKAKALDVPVWQLLGGKSRNYVECYATAFPRPAKGTLEDAARACVDAGFRAYRHATDNPGEREVDRFKLVRKMQEDCMLLHKGAGDGGWAIDFHTDSTRPTRSNRHAARTAAPVLLRRSDSQRGRGFVRDDPRAYSRSDRRRGQFGYKWDINTLIERQLIDYTA